jgi:hypothetical protein
MSFFVFSALDDVFGVKEVCGNELIVFCSAVSKQYPRNARYFTFLKLNTFETFSIFNYPWCLWLGVDLKV